MTIPSVLGNNAALYYNTSGTGSWTLISNVKSISVPEPEWAVVNVPGLADTVDIKQPGFLDNKSFSAELYHTTANKALIDTTLPGLLMYYKVEMSDSSGWSFEGILKSWKGKLDRNNALVYECTFEITGALTPTTS